jgi:hypothetical protein
LSVCVLCVCVCVCDRESVPYLVEHEGGDGLAADSPAVSLALHALAGEEVDTCSCSSSSSSSGMCVCERESGSVSE